MNCVKNDIFIVPGPAKIRIESGLCSIVGANFTSGEVEIPKGKSIPVEVKEDSVLEISGEFTKIESSTIPQQWDALVEKFLKKMPRIILVLGEVDTGKTFFSTYLANSFINKKKKVSMIDCDVGQSDIGPPGTIGLAVFEKPVVFVSDVKPSALFYLGSHSPGLHLVPAVVGIKKICEVATELSDVVIIDTPGWVQGDGGRLLRTSEIDIIEPDKIVLLQRGDELEHLIKREKPEKIERIHVSKKATATSDADRKHLREIIASKYYRDMKKIEIPFEKVSTDRSFFLTGKSISPSSVKTLHAERLSGWEGILVATEKPLSNTEMEALKKEFSVFNVRNIVKGTEKNAVVGLLNSNKNCLGLGILDEIDYTGKKFVLSTPVKNTDKIKIIQFGSIKFSPQTMKEAGFVEPGYF